MSKPTRIDSLAFPDGSIKASAAFWSGYHDDSVAWQLTSNTFVDFTVISGAANLIERASSGFDAVSTAPSNLPGITFTPASIDSAYMITAVFAMYVNGPSSGNVAAAMRMVGGATEEEISSNSSAYKPAGVTAFLGPATIQGIFRPGTTSPVTVKLQGFVSGDPTYFLQVGYINVFIEWTVVRVE